MTATLSSRAETILGRFPRHLALADDTKMVASVVAELAAELDVATSTVGRVRRNHRLGDVDNQWDLLSLGALADLDERDDDVLERRLGAVVATGAALAAAPDDVDVVADNRAGLADLVALPGDVFAPLADDPDDTASNQRLAAALQAASRYTAEMALRRRQTLDLVALHQSGNASVGALLGATASVLALDVDTIVHSDDRYWHFAICADRIRLGDLTPAPEFVALEENPFSPADVTPSPRWHGQLLAITRAGWEDVPVTVRVVGIGERTVAPMVVNIDTGDGVVYTGTVPDGEEVRFLSSGQVTLGPSGGAGDPSVTRRCFSFSGGVFASEPAHIADFVWADRDDPLVGADRAATFTVTAPVADGFDPAVVLPHGGGLLDAPTMQVDTSRWAFFVRSAHFGRSADTGVESASPTFLAGIWDRSVFDPTDDDNSRAPSGEVGFEWEEREAFAVCVWLPRRFETLDDPPESGTESIRARVRILLNRYRAAGVHVRVEYADDRWTLGTGILRDNESAEATGIVVAGTGLWSTSDLEPEPEPEPIP